MADKITVAEAVNLANQNTTDLTNEQLIQMNEAFAETFMNGEPRSAEVQMASSVTIAEIDARLEALAEKQDLYNDEDLDSIIAMAETVGMFSQKADVAQTVLKRAQAQKEAMAAAAQNIEIVDDQENQQQDTQQESNQSTQESNQPESTQAQAQENTQPESTQTQESTQAETPNTENQNIDTAEESTEDNQAIEIIENMPEDQVELDKFDREGGIDKVTQEQLEKNDKIIDGILPPLSVDKSGKLINPEFQEELNAIHNLTITDDNGKELSAEEQATARGDLIVAAQLEAETEARVLGNGNPEDVEKLYKALFKEALQRNIVSAAFASGAKKGMSKEQLQEKFAQAVNNPQKAKIKAVRAVAANGYAKSEKIVDRLKNKFKSIPVVQKMDKKVKAFDQRMTEQYGKKWQVAKRLGKAAWKSVGNAAIYAGIGAMSGPAAPVAFLGLAAKSAYDSAKALQAEAKKNNMKFRQYVKKNPGKVVLAATSPILSLAGAAVGVGNSIGTPGNNAQVVQTALKYSARGLAVAKNGVPSLWHAAKAGYKKFVKKDNEAAQVEWGKAKENFNRAVEAAIGITVGAATADFISGDQPQTAANHDNSAANHSNSSTTVFNDDNTVNWDKTMTHDWQNGTDSQETPTTAMPNDAQQMTPEEMTKTLEEMGLHPDDVRQMSPEYMQRYIMTHQADYQATEMTTQDKDGDGIVDALDADHGQGWAKANETQLGRLMDADPAKVNALLGGTDYKSSELRAMFESGQFNDEQLKGIHELATKEFDENGHIIDADLNAYYENLAKEAEIHEASNATGSDISEHSTTEHENSSDSNSAINMQPQMTEKDQQAYQAILNIVQKGENMADPEVRASVEGVAMGHLQEIKEAIANGDDKALINKVMSLHEQGERQEVNLATRENEDDSRKLANAKESLREAQAKLDEARAAFAQDSNNPKLAETVQKLEKETVKEAFDLTQRTIKENVSDLSEQIKHEVHAYENRDKAYINIEKATGLNEEQIKQGLSKLGLDVNNLPEDKSSLSAEAQGYIKVHEMYEQARQNEKDLIGDIKRNMDEKAGWQEYGKLVDADEKAFKHGQGLSEEAQERLPGQSKLNQNSELIKAINSMSR